MGPPGSTGSPTESPTSEPTFIPTSQLGVRWSDDSIDEWDCSAHSLPIQILKHDSDGSCLRAFGRVDAAATTRKCPAHLFNVTAASALLGRSASLAAVSTRLGDLAM